MSVGIRSKDFPPTKNEALVLIRFLSVKFLLLIIIGLSAISVAAFPLQTANPEADQNLKWRKKRIAVSISNVFPEVLNGSFSRNDFENAVRESFESWSRETDIEFSFKKVPNSNISGKKSGGDGISLVTIAPTSDNLLLFGEKDTNKSAVTRLFFDSEGFITEADIVLNPTARFATDGSPGSFDLKSTLTHEAGHFLGLGHSAVVGSTMHKNQAKNGTFALSATYFRTLSEDDKAVIRSIYGPATSLKRSFGTIEGAIESARGESLLAGANVWIESLESGRVIAGVKVGNNGAFVLKSVPPDGYRLFAADKDGVPLTAGVLVFVEGGQRSAVRLEIESPEKHLPILGMFGFNGQLSDLAVPVERGHSYAFIYGSRGLNPGQIRITSTSPGIVVEPASTSHLYTSGETAIIGFEVFISPTAQPGEYSLRVYEGERLVTQVPGIVTIDEVPNPWYSTLF